MPSHLQSYDILLDLTNDMHDSVSIQLLRDYGRGMGAVVLLNPTETVTLVLESGSAYRYAVKSRTKVANVTARSWRDTHCYISHLFSSRPSDSTADLDHPVDGVSVDRLWRDHRFCVWAES